MSRGTKAESEEKEKRTRGEGKGRTLGRWGLTLTKRYRLNKGNERELIESRGTESLLVGGKASTDQRVKRQFRMVGKIRGRSTTLGSEGKSHPEEKEGRSAPVIRT